MIEYPAFHVLIQMDTSYSACFSMWHSRNGRGDGRNDATGAAFFSAYEIWIHFGSKINRFNSGL
jgi:hypothetical protein